MLNMLDTDLPRMLLRLGTSFVGAPTGVGRACGAPHIRIQVVQRGPVEPIPRWNFQRQWRHLHWPSILRGRRMHLIYPSGNTNRYTEIIMLNILQV